MPMKIRMLVCLSAIALHSYYTTPADLLVIDRHSFVLVDTAYQKTKE
jgi:hypothetical protein